MRLLVIFVSHHSEEHSQQAEPDNGLASLVRNRTMTMEKSVFGSATTKFSSNQPPDVAKSTSFTTRPQLRKSPLRWIQSVVAKLPKPTTAIQTTTPETS
jgi:hypothetical protein